MSARVASARQGVAIRHDLLDAGLTRHVLVRRAQTGELHRKYRGVYIVGHTALAPRAEEVAALSACGEHALISHRSAAYLWSFITARPHRIDVTLVGRRCRPKEGIALHFLSQIDRRDVGCIDDLPMTAAARTVIDLAADDRTDDDELEAAISEARALKRIRAGDLERALERDRKKDQVLTAAGYRVIRITRRQLTQEPIRVIAAIASALALGRAV